jgi:ELWxxDGT repeat protein
MKKNLTFLLLLSVFNFFAQNIDVTELELNFTGDSKPKKLTKGLSKLYFVADDGIHMNELWVHDIITNTTYLVKDIFSGSGGMDNSTLLTIGDILYFTVNQGTQLWRSDGTESGTFLVKHINDNFWSYNSIPSLFNYNGNLVFSANDGISGQELWISDGTTDGTMLLKDIRVGPNTNSYPSGFATCNGILYFTADDGINGLEVWKSDGTTEGTTILKDIVPGIDGSIMGGTILSFNNHIYFYAYSSVNGFELWKSDGTASGTNLLKDINVGPNSSNNNLVAISDDDYFIFQVDLPSVGRELWISDGTVNGTLLLKDINPSGNGIPLSPQFAKFNNKIYFNAYNPLSGEELWVTDGTTEGTQIVKDIYPGTTSSYIETLRTTSNYLIFKARNGANTYNSLWKSDGTTSGTIELKNINFNLIPIEDVNFVELNNVVYFPGHNLTNGIELWTTDGTTTNTNLFLDIFHLYSGMTDFYDVAELGGKLIFTGNNGNGSEPFITDGTVNGSHIIKDINAGSGSAFFTSSGHRSASYTKAGNYVFFRATGNGSGYEIWKTDGTEANTSMVKDIRAGSASSISEYTFFMEYNGIFYFKANDGISGEELWRSDGTEIGTYLVKDINPGPNSSIGDQSNIFYNSDYILNEKGYATLNGYLYFAAYDGIDCSIWKTNGTESGTIKVITIPISGVYDTKRVVINATDNKIFFKSNTNNSSYGNHSLWSSDGTQAGTLFLGLWSNTATQFKKNIVFNNSLFFTVNSNSAGRTLMKTDGTISGTIVVKENFTTESTFTSLYECGNFVYFSVGDQGPGYYGKELWRTDGTTIGTIKLGDLTSSVDSFIGCTTCYQDNLLFLKETFNTNKIYYVNGNSTNTDSFLTTNITNSENFGELGYYFFSNLYKLNNKLLFSASKQYSGTELYSTEFEFVLDSQDFDNTVNNSRVLIYPNPANSKVNIKVLDNSTILNVKIYDLLGKEIYFSKNNSELDLSNLNNGIYLIKVSTSNSSHNSKLVIKH